MAKAIRIPYGRSLWHGRKMMQAYDKTQDWQAPDYVHHHRCFVMLSAIENGRWQEFEELKREPVLNVARRMNSCRKV